MHQGFLDDQSSGVDPNTRLNDMVSTAVGKVRSLDEGPQSMGYYTSQYSAAKELLYMQKAPAAAGSKANATQMAKLTLETYVKVWRNEQNLAVQP